MPAATHGARIASEITEATAASSPTETATLLAGSGEVLTAARRPALTAWLARAVAPPAVAATACSNDEASPAMSAPSAAPTAGRITVCTASQVLSTYGTLSATTSTRNSTPATIRTSVRCNASGICASPKTRSAPPRISTTR